MTIFEIIYVILLVLTLGMSIISLKVSLAVSQKDQAIKIREKYYDEIFSEMITKKIPYLYNKFVNKEIGNINVSISSKFEKEIGFFREKIRFLEFNYPNFYKELDSQLIDLDDKVVLLSTKPENVQRLIPEFYDGISNVYRLVERFYTKHKL